MARFGACAVKWAGRPLDCQADLLSGLYTRLAVVPRSPETAPPRPAGRRNAVFEGARYVIAMQFAAAVPVRAIGSQVGSLIHEETTIIGAIDMPLSGY